MKESSEKEEGVAKIETTTDELKPSGEKPKVEIAVTPASEKEEPLYKSSLRIRAQPKAKVSGAVRLCCVSIY